MTIANEPAGYTGTQILLHWTIAGLIVLQLVIGEDIKPAYRAFSRGTEPAAADIFNANIHVYVGLAVLVLAIWRIAVRLRDGVPAAPPEESVLLKRIAAAAHFLLYLFIFGMPITGILAWYFSFRAMGDIHELAKPVIIIFVGLHAAAALWQHFYVKSDVLVRILRPAGRRTR
ncbi:MULTISPECIES: cytochrome b/b6 domain-containing protein [unclassified Mesorhizobium]|uniref:cytochrome b n=1 Tax=unclassified Mesorhizobium TaxID=325217 RepID=UPI000F75EB5B|nr:MULTISPECIES: cytochrome b/b6 domain-containing protein [unclassified Mesorhizobium]AZO54714.1 cytochrome b [Mesorhizobium sp. M8A.F.Ca.ET.057.01.1.1]RWE44367.1 MAG: cytochrome b [Mesorhizobium sp.]TJX39141.1 MAG: cytochrome b [Mesorhizobium sp.]